MNHDPSLDPNATPDAALQEEPHAALQRAVALHHEPVSVSVRGVLLWGVALMILLVGTTGLMYFLVVLFAGTALAPNVVATPVESAHPVSRPPVVEANQAFTTRAQRQRMQETLAHYAWINKEAGIARIPIERAMAIYAQRELQPAVTDPTDTEPSTDQAEQE